MVDVEQGGDYDSDRDVNGLVNCRDRVSDDETGRVEQDDDDDDDDDEYDSEEDEDYDVRPKKKKRRSAVSKFIVEEAGKHAV